MSQRAIVNRLRWMQQAFPLDASDRVLHKTPCGFDVSVWELCWPLMFGAGIVIAEPGGHRDTGYLLALMAEQRVSTVHFVPSMLGAFLLEPELGRRLPALRRIVCSGEALPAALVRDCAAALPGTEVHNLYGPTEAAVDVTWHRCLPGEDPVPIGSPIANTRVQVLDAHGVRVPVGVLGELCLAGVQLAHGYLGRPALTAAAFTPDPVWAARQPDLPHRRPRPLVVRPARLEYHGRLDDQVKVRGMRVEPGAAEAVLTSLPEVRAAAVVPHTDDEGVRLVAYVTASNPADPPSPELLRRRLAAVLPEQSVPTGYYLLDELPLTANGKLDRAALPEPVVGLPAKAEYTEPATEAERAVAEVWRAVLGAARVGAEDDFFALGGDSIRALKVVARLRAAGYPSQLPDLFLPSERSGAGRRARTGRRLDRRRPRGRSRRSHRSHCSTRRPPMRCKPGSTRRTPTRWPRCRPACSSTASSARTPRPTTTCSPCACRVPTTSRRHWRRRWPRSSPGMTSCARRCTSPSSPSRCRWCTRRPTSPFDCGICGSCAPK